MARNRNMRKATLLERLTFWKVTRRRWTFLVARQPCSNREANLPHGRCCIWQKFYHLFHKGPPSLQSYVLYYASTTINLCFGPSFKPLALEIGGGGRRAGGRKEDLLCAEPTQPRPKNGVRSLLCPLLWRPRCGTLFRLRWEGEWVCECGEKGTKMTTIRQKSCFHCSPDLVALGKSGGNAGLFFAFPGPV